MRRGLFGLLAGVRGTSVVASTPMKLAFLLWLFSGRRPSDTTTGPISPADRDSRADRLKVGWVG